MDANGREWTLIFEGCFVAGRGSGLFFFNRERARKDAKFERPEDENGMTVMDLSVVKAG